MRTSEGLCFGFPHLSVGRGACGLEGRRKAQRSSGPDTHPDGAAVSRPLVSVVSAVYNSERYLRESLESVVYCFTRYRHADGNTEPAPWKGSGIGEECET